MESKESTLWRSLGMDLERHDAFLSPLPKVYEEIFLSQPNRPKGMAYFDTVMSGVHSLRVEELVAHKQRGGFVVGTYCVYVPEELILAMGGIPVGLCAGAHFSVPAAEAVLPQTLCPLIKSTFGFYLERICPYMQACDLIVGETTCDGKKKAWEIMAGGLPIYVMELPQKKGPKDEELWQSEVWGLLDEIRTRFHAQMPSVQSLQNAIHKVNRKRSALKALYALRQNDPPPISGKDSLLISQLAFFDDPERFGSQVEALNEELKARVGRGEGVAPKGSPRLLIAGTPMPLPDWKLHHILETSGGVAVAEETCTGTRYFEASVQGDAKTQEGLIESIADRFLGVHCACFSPNPERIEDILRLAKSQNADGVIYATLPFCQTYQLEFPRVQEALREAGIPLLSIESDFSDEDAGQLSTRIQAFLEMIGK